MGLLFDLLMPLMLAGIALYGMVRRVDVYDAVIHGAGDGLGVLYRIVPPLIALLTAVSMLRAPRPWRRSWTRWAFRRRRWP